MRLKILSPHHGERDSIWHIEDDDTGEIVGTLHTGWFARSVESGWLGKVIGVDERFPDMLKMKGVNTLCLTIAGGSHDEWLDDDDVQWFDPRDLVFLKIHKKVTQLSD